MVAFADSPLCRDRIACRDCRSSRHFRETLSQAFELPDGVVDFECPFGVPWGEPVESATVAPAVRIPLVDEGRTARRLAVCDQCEMLTTTTGIKFCGNPLTGKHESGQQGCGCMVSLKARLASSKCPLDKWET